MPIVRRIFLRQCHAKIVHIVGYVNDFCMVLPEKKTSRMSMLFCGSSLV